MTIQKIIIESLINEPEKWGFGSSSARLEGTQPGMAFVCGWNPFYAQATISGQNIYFNLLDSFKIWRIIRKHWKTRESEQRDELVETFKRIVDNVGTIE